MNLAPEDVPFPQKKNMPPVCKQNSNARSENSDSEFLRVLRTIPGWRPPPPLPRLVSRVEKCSTRKFLTNFRQTSDKLSITSKYTYLGGFLIQTNFQTNFRQTFWKIGVPTGTKCMAGPAWPGWSGLDSRKFVWTGIPPRTNLVRIGFGLELFCQQMCRDAKVCLNCWL